MHVADKSPLKRKSSRAYLDFKRENGTNCVEYIKVYVYETRITSWWKQLYVGTEYGGHESFRINGKKEEHDEKKNNFLNEGQKFQLDYSSRFCIGNMKRDIASLNISSV